MSKLAIHFWDMDHTVIDNDCDVSWKEFLVIKGLAPENTRDKIDLFWQQYVLGKLQLDQFLEFQLLEFIGKSKEEIKILAYDHFESVVKRRIYREVPRLLHNIRGKSECLCLITATNRVIAEPVATYLGFDNLLGTELEVRNNIFTGRISGPYCGGEGKIPYIERFCERLKTTPDHCYYYGDSIADIPILEYIGSPVAVNPMPGLREHAEIKEWKILNFKKPFSET